jgi:hypothetical protein
VVRQGRSRVQGFIAVGGTRANGQGVVKILAISHANDQDLSVTLLHLPTGTPVPLFHERRQHRRRVLVWILDSAATDMGVADNATGGAITGTFNLEGAEVLSEFASEDGSGEWRLRSPTARRATPGRSSPGACESATEKWTEGRREPSVRHVEAPQDEVRGRGT